MKPFYMSILVWALHQLLGTARGNAALAKVLPILALAQSGGLDDPSPSQLG